MTRIAPIAPILLGGAFAWAHTGVMARVLIVLLLIIGRLAYVHTHEYRDCRWSRPGHHSGCWRCHGTGMTRRWGAWHTHKLALALRQAWAERKERWQQVPESAMAWPI
jgi:hypothetical protein